MNPTLHLATDSEISHFLQFLQFLHFLHFLHFLQFLKFLQFLQFLQIVQVFACNYILACISLVRNSRNIAEVTMEFSL